MVTLVNYGLGNIRALHHIYTRLNLPVNVASTAMELVVARKLILPGVGAFDWAMSRLDASGMREALDELVLEKKVPVLGICVGMQMMTRRSDEGELPGLGWMDAEVKWLGSEEGRVTRGLALPHMGWNDVVPAVEHSLFSGLVEPRFYFLHSYYFVPGHPQQILATTNYGGEFTSAAGNGHIFGVQFHPEKSHSWGIRLLRNFAAWSEK